MLNSLKRLASSKHQAFALFAVIALVSGVDVSGSHGSGEKERSFNIEIIAEGLNKPMAIAMNSYRTLYYSEVPEPGVPAGENAVKRLDLRSKGSSVISQGEPYPLNIALDRRGNVFWTCNTAGVILKYSRYGGGKAPYFPVGFDPNTTPLEDRLMKPSGITVDRYGEVLFTEVPDPGNVGLNMVSVTDGNNVSLISDGEPAPTDIVVSYNGTAYWTCKDAGVILRRSPAGVIGKLLDGLEKPTGIALDRTGRYLYFTEIPTPGEFGGDVGPGGDGRNRVMEYDLWKQKMTQVSFGFPLPTDVAVAPNGKIYWTCTTVGVIACATPEGGRRSRWGW
ncbi:MAG: hypothetical protein HN457_10685 [Opitutales bacterium]|jgi:sugar lactone lactonase YvrE|nr:hypothetical protein [Opitutales bacterium]MBT5816274.1 hypothetical protein [Opitutales bacterium]